MQSLRSWCLPLILLSCLASTRQLHSIQTGQGRQEGSQSSIGQRLKRLGGIFGAMSTEERCARFATAVAALIVAVNNDTAFIPAVVGGLSIFGNRSSYIVGLVLGGVSYVKMLTVAYSAEEHVQIPQSAIDHSQSAVAPEEKPARLCQGILCLWKEQY